MTNRVDSTRPLVLPEDEPNNNMRLGEMRPAADPNAKPYKERVSPFVESEEERQRMHDNAWGV